MAEPFKNLLSKKEVAAARTHLARVEPDFDGARFEALALRGLESLELKARAEHLCAALEATLPKSFQHSAAAIERALAPAILSDDLAALRTGPLGLAGWVLWPMGEFVARRGLGEPERALGCLHAITQRFTAEWAIRPFLEQHTELAFQTLARWCADPSLYVRRLVSEGSRPRLPWGRQLKALIADPAPTLPLLARLQDDPSEYVRRSVANHLNDIAKDHPELVADWVERHVDGANHVRKVLLRRAARTLVKSGHPRTLAAFGLGRALRGDAELLIAPQRVRIGASVRLAVRVHSRARSAQPLEIDYAVHHVKANGETSPKVFKGWRRELAAGADLELEKTHSLRRITTRTYHPGEHRIELRINGKTVAQATFCLGR